MALLDRFRAQPGQKHPDPIVRLAFVQEIPLDERELLAEIAREDADARVRAAAVAKVMDPSVLQAIARGDGDESVRRDALMMLRDIALDAFEGLTEAQHLAAVDAIEDVKTLVIVAKSSEREVVAVHALARVTDVHALGSIARHAKVEPVRRIALDQIDDLTEVLAVAMNSEFKDTAVGAVERIADRRQLEEIGDRARNKSAAKRARMLLREMDERQAAEAAAQAAADAAARPSAQQIQETPTDPPTPDADHAEDPVVIGERAALAERERAEVEAAARQREEERAAVAERDEQRRQQQQAQQAADEEARRRQAALREQDARIRREALARVHQLLARVEPLAARDDLTLKAGDRALRDLRTMLEAIPPLPSRQDFEDVSGRLKAVQAVLTPKVHELREAAEWQQWANVGIQENLCAQMEALATSEDPEAIARQVRELQAKWRTAADVPRAQAEALWRRFRAAHDRAWQRCEAHFAAQAEQRSQNLARKLALCERAESLAESTNWIQTAEEIKKLQAEWKTVGPVGRGHEKATWERFRTACDRFFTRRHADLADRKKLWAENLAKKTALCVSAEALADSTDWDAAAAEIRRLQAEWKTIGPVKKTRSEAIWQRFRGACDQFFSRYSQRHDIARTERVAARERICEELEALARGESDTTDAGSNAAPPDLVAAVRALRSRWQQEAAPRGVDREHAAALDARFQTAFTAVLSKRPAVFSGTELDIESNRQRMEALVRKLEDLARAVAGPERADAGISPTARLASMLKEALAANTIGGKIDGESRIRAAAEDVRSAQASWSRIGPVPDDVRRELTDRFQRAARYIMDRAGAAAGPGRAGAAARPGR